MVFGSNGGSARSESAEAAHVLSECKAFSAATWCGCGQAALEKHDVEEQKQAELLEENAELEGALRVDACRGVKKTAF